MQVAGWTLPLARRGRTSPPGVATPVRRHLLCVTLNTGLSLGPQKELCPQPELIEGFLDKLNWGGGGVHQFITS